MTTNLLTGAPVGDPARTLDQTQDTMDALAGAVTAGQFLGGDGKHVTMRAIPVSALPAGALPRIYSQATASLTPSASHGNYGTASTLTPDTGFVAVFPTAVNIVTTGLATETVTVQAVVTFSDNTTATSTVAITTSTTTDLTVAQRLALLSGGDGKYVKSIAWSCKSSIDSSAAAATVNVLGLNHN